MIKKALIFLVVLIFVYVVGSFIDKNRESTSTSTSQESSTSTSKSTSTSTNQKEKPKEKPKQKSNILIDTMSIRPIFNGIGTKEVGKYAYIKMSKSTFKTLCTDETLLEFTKHIEKNKNKILYTIIDFGDGTVLQGLESSYTYQDAKENKKIGGFELEGKGKGDIKVYIDTNEVKRTKGILE